VIDTPNGEVEIPVDIVEAPVADDLDDAPEAPVADLLPVAPTEPDDLERQLAKDEEMERQNRHQQHETPHFRKESD
jgi:hypothetical protein